MKKRIFNKGELWLMRLLLRNRFLSGERGSNGAGIWARNNKSGISDFLYRFDGTIGGNNYSYSVAKEDGTVTFTYESLEYPELSEAKIKVDESVLHSLNEIYLTYRLAEWNGFSKYNRHIYDGDGFSLRITFNDGAQLNANGTNTFPPRYGEFRAAMGTILDPFRDELLNSADEK